MITYEPLPSEFRRFYKPDGSVSKEYLFPQRYQKIEFTKSYRRSSELGKTKFLPPLAFDRRLFRDGTAIVNYKTYSIKNKYLITEGSEYIAGVNHRSLINAGIREYNSRHADFRNRAINNLNNSELNLGMTFAGANQTFQMIARAAIGVRTFAKNLRSGNLQGAAKAVGLKPTAWRNVSRDASDRYLEFLFGWKQLMSDAYAAVNEFEVSQKAPPPLITSRVSSTYYVDEEAKRNFTSIHGPIGTLYGYGSAKIRSVARYDYEVESWDRILANRLGLLNPAVLAWDRVPYTFVFDWFFPLGSYLSSYTAQAGMKYLGGTETLYVNSRVKHAFVQGSYRDYRCEANITNESSFDSYVINRNVVSFPYPMIPSIRYPNSLGQALTSVALITQRILR